MPRNSNALQVYSNRMVVSPSVTVGTATVTVGNVVVRTDRVSGHPFQVGILLQAPVDQVIYVATRECTVQSVRAIPVVAGTDGSAVTCTVMRCQGTEAPSAGDDLLGATKIDLKGTVDTLQSPALTATTANLTLAAGNRLAIDVTGTPTAVVCFVQVELVYT